MKTINILGDTQRDQWHGVVNMLRQLGGDMTREGRSALCDELDRYIDAMEDANDSEEEVYVLTSYGRTECSMGGVAYVYDSLEAAQQKMREEVAETISDFELDADNLGEFQSINIGDTSAFVENLYDEWYWKIERKTI